MIAPLVKKGVDKFLSVLAIIFLSPVMLIAAVGIKLSSNGPVLYRAKRMGKDGKPFIAYKFRTMRVGADRSGSITALNDTRIFPWGDILRKTKADELPQLFNILQGTMSIIGPRPEDVDIVNKYYTEEEKKTLSVLPGLASPGSIFNYTHGGQFLKKETTAESYAEEFLHIKLALDLYYLKNWSLLYDMELIARTVYTILVISFTRVQLDYPKEYRHVFCSVE